MEGEGAKEGSTGVNVLLKGEEAIGYWEKKKRGEV